MTISIYCAAIAVAAGILGASPRKALLMGGGIGFVSGVIALAVERRINDWWDLYPVATLALMFAASAAIMAFTVAKTKR
ncbi:MAG: hypothetical protein ACN6OP_14870 [Pseudomonadales bacterium]